VVRYGQRVEVGSEGVVAEAQPSGSGLGHAVWVLGDGEHRCGLTAMFVTTVSQTGRREGADGVHVRLVPFVRDCSQRTAVRGCCFCAPYWRHS
jgi:hypothetical protein